MAENPTTWNGSWSVSAGGQFRRRGVDLGASGTTCAVSFAIASRPSAPTVRHRRFMQSAGRYSSLSPLTNSSRDFKTFGRFLLDLGPQGHRRLAAGIA